ncbi:hypothetical protein [Cupriavidus sp. YR651]|uniref:hypothetical protein n=1 Tax=Cupriavidus sp. YR651 TaxID=1855315 RepID=UPI000AE9C2AC|nr:hypothetical protein [Cupriavidus sp. YR651]
MSRKFVTTFFSAAVFAGTFLAGAAHASGPRDSTFAGDKYGYNFRIDTRDVFSDGARAGRFDTFSEGARDIAPATREINNARSLAGMDRSGVSAEPSRMIDVFTDGALAGMDRSGVSAEPSRKMDVFTDGALAGMDRSGVSAEPSRKMDVFTDGALAGMDRSGVSAEPSRKFDVFTDGQIA